MKRCSRCESEKPLEAFSTNGKSGIHPICKLCTAEKVRIARLADPEKFRLAEKARYAKNKAGKKAARRRYYLANSQALKNREHARYRLKAEEIKEQKKAYRGRNKHRIREWNGTRRAQLRQAMPKWVDRKVIASIYSEASRLWQETGIEHHVDHIVPLSNAVVCGLHVPANLQIISGAENLKKRNSFTQ